MRKIRKTLKQCDKRRLSVLMRMDQWDELKVIQKSEGTYMIDVVEYIIDLGLRLYNEDIREVGGGEEDDDKYSYLYD